MLHTLRFSLQNAVYFIMLPFLVPVLFTFCIQNFIYIFFSTTISTEYFKHAAHSQFFPSKCLLFYNATFFGSCIIHILHTGVVKFKCNI